MGEVGTWKGSKDFEGLVREGREVTSQIHTFFWTKNVIVFITKSIFLVHLRNFFQKSIFFKLLYDRFVCFFPFKRLNLGFLLTLNSQGKTLQSSKRKQKNCLAESFICEYFWHIAKEWTGSGINRMLNLKSNTEQLATERFLDNS